MKDHRQTALELVYSASTPEELAKAYRVWADTYDRETLAEGYCLPFVIAGWLARHVRPEDGEVLDAGCGTGLSAPVLQALGFSNLAGLDFSPEMLAAARSRGGYGDLIEAELGKELPLATGRFGAFISTGVFTAGHAPAVSLYELVRVLKPGGFAIFTIRQNIASGADFDQVMNDLSAKQDWQPVETSEPFRAFAIAEPEVLVRAYVFKKR